MTKLLPKNLTSYDLLKSFAVIIMVVDHIGWYFYPEDLWWRAIGRIGFPVWFFLVGYAKSRSLHWKLWVGTLLLMAGNMAAGMFVFPLCALATILAIRLLIDPLMKAALYDHKSLIAFSVVLFALVISTGMFVEYGTIALIMAMLGYMVRLRAEGMIPNDRVTLFTGFALAAFLAMQQAQFNFSQPQLVAMIVGTLIVTAALYVFRPVEYPVLTGKMPRPLTWILQLGGRRTLEIYVVHLLLFKLLMVLVQPDRFTPFHWTLFYVEN